ncbi:MAG: hypothetical protein HUU26_03870 [Gemmatimonadaceae bacterium]|nr:hypothetical protein [Gemmatimonadaceae bacterium]
MKLRSLVLPALVVAAPAPLAFGGWAVVTIDNPPRALAAGVPFTIDYTVRQHGVELMPGLRGSVEAVSGRHRVKVDARPLTTGRYTATVTIPEPGDWTITVHSGFGPSRTTLLPLRVARAGAVAEALPDAEYGRHLFAAKGCAVCHVEMKLAPDPRTQSYDAAFVKKLLADPQSVPKRRASPVDMPNLGLTATEIAALTAYLAGPHPAGTR